MSIEKSGMMAYVANAMGRASDYSFLPPETFARMVEALVDIDLAYMESSGAGEEGVYDDEAAYDLLFVGLKERFPQHHAYCMRMVEDYMDAVEAYLESTDSLEWD